MPIEFSRLKLGNLYDRPALAAMWGYEGFQAISRGVVTPKGQNLIVLFVTRFKQKALTQYVDFIQDGLLHWEGEDGHGNDQRIASAEKTGTAIHLFYRELHHRPFEYKGLVRPLGWELESQRPSRFRFALVSPDPVQNDLIAHEDEIAIVPSTERVDLVKSRIGQGLFRERLISAWGGCAVTGATQIDVLRASHIKPWRYSTNEERLSPANGLLLSPTLDTLFDAGYVSFETNGRILTSIAITGENYRRLGIQAEMHLLRSAPECVDFLRYHQEEIFLA
jgi:putative restriction endonuclease